MPDPTALLGPAVDVTRGFIDRFFGDGNVRVKSEQGSKQPWNCDRNEQLRQVCPWRRVRRRIATYRTRTYALFKGVGYTSQSFEVRLIGWYDGCDISGAFITVSRYDEATIGRTNDWTVTASVVDSPITGPSGCDDCCPRCTSLSFNVTVNTGGFVDTVLVTLFGNGRVTVEQL